MSLNMHDGEPPLTITERAQLAPFLTDLDAPIFGLRNLPEVVKGALFSRYSRSEHSLRRILLDEFMRAPDAAFGALAGDTTVAAAQIDATRRAEAFYDRVLLGYGDDSVAELGGAHLACEQISNIAAKVIEDARIGLSPLEKSTRYVRFDSMVGGRYRYVREPTIMASRHASAYAATLDGLFSTYADLMEPTLAAVRASSPRDANTGERAYASATRAKACDLLRGLLPMATRTNVGLFGNGRAYEYLITRLRAQPLTELHTIADGMQQSLDALIPSFVKRAKTERGAAYASYLRTTRAQSAAAAAALALPTASAPAPLVALIDADADGEARVLAAILYPHSDLPLDALRQHAATMPASERAALLHAYVGERNVRFHRPGRALEEARYTFVITADIGAYRDLQRHRMLSQERRPYTTGLGFVTPPELVEAGLAQSYSAALETAAATYTQIAAELPEEAQYVVPFAYRISWRITMNLREAYHFCELRSAPQGHIAYRRVAQEIYTQIAAVHPLLAAGMRFVDMTDRPLERLDAERRMDEKLRRAAGDA